MPPRRTGQLLLQYRQWGLRVPGLHGCFQLGVLSRVQKFPALYHVLKFSLVERQVSFPRRYLHNGPTLIGTTVSVVNVKRTKLPLLSLFWPLLL